MDMTTTCPACGCALSLGERFAGREAECGRCGAVFVADPGPDPEPAARPGGDGGGFAVLAVAAGLAGLVLWCCPPVGLVVGLCGLACGGLGLQSRRRPLAVCGLVLSLVGVVAAVGAGALVAAGLAQEVELADPAAGGNRPPFVSP